MAAKILDIDLAENLPPLQNLLPYRRALILWRWRGIPLGQSYLDIPADGIFSAQFLKQTAHNALGDKLASAYLESWLSKGEKVPAGEPNLPPCTVIICTKDRAEDLQRCLESIFANLPPKVEVIVVDNASSDEQTRRIVARFPARYIFEARPGLNWARQTGARQAATDLLLYTDDDVVVDLNWINEMRRSFTSAQTGAVTGLVMPLELETEAQEKFERYSGFGRGFSSEHFTAMIMPPAAAGKVGAGANMALRRQLVLDLNLFGVELDCGTATKSGGDTYAFYRLLAEGYRLVYNPHALVWHRHRRDEQALKSVLSGYGTGVYAFLLRAVFKHHDLQAVAVGAEWFTQHHIRQLWRRLWKKEDAQPFNLTLAEIKGAFSAPLAYFLSRRRERNYLSEESYEPAN